MKISNKDCIDEYIKDSNGEYWYQNGQLHRLDGPAVQLTSGTKYWCQNGNLHRLDGPAIEKANGYKEWRFNSENLNLLQYILKI